MSVAPVRVHIRAASEALVAELTRLLETIDAMDVGTLRRLAKLAQSHHPPSHAAERTVSPQRRAGSRRTKRHARATP
jgi:hypothetical protein